MDGLTIFFTGLSGSGKTTLAQALMERLVRQEKKNVTFLDGDVFRQTYCQDLGFSKADRNENIRRIGLAAAEITKRGGVALCAAIAPYAESRDENRRLISRYGKYIEVYISTPLSICENRDPKGLYAKVRAGIIKGFTGIDDPYEKPMNAEITIDTSILSLNDSINKIITFLNNRSYKKISESRVILEEVF